MRGHKESGFSLIELSIVLIIVGLLMVPILQAFDLYLKERRMAKTENSFARITEAIDLFQNDHERLPCPADPVQAHPWDDPGTPAIENDPRFGVEFCDARLMAMNTCSGPGNTGVCRVAAGVDVNNDGDATNDAILIGVVPYMDMGIQAISNSDSDAMVISLNNGDSEDGYGYKIYYAVTEDLVDDTTYDVNRNGVGIEIRRKPNNMNPNPAPDNRRTSYVLVSVGQNGIGGYNANRVINFPCNGIVGVNGLDLENCDRDANFVQDYGRNDNAANFYDDKVLYSIQADKGLWISAGGNDIRNNTTGRVGIGTGSPRANLDINGNLRTSDLQSQRICAQSVGGVAEDCFSPDAIGGQLADGGGMDCPNGEAMTGIENGDTVCATLNITAPPAVYNCPSGCYAVGIRTNGRLICSDGTNTCP